MRLMRLLVVSCLLGCACGYGLPRRNLVRNGSFEEQGERGGAQQWTFERGRADAEGGIHWNIPPGVVFGILFYHGAHTGRNLYFSPRRPPLAPVP